MLKKNKTKQTDKNLFKEKLKVLSKHCQTWRGEVQYYSPNLSEAALNLIFKVAVK